MCAGEHAAAAAAQALPGLRPQRAAACSPPPKLITACSARQVSHAAMLHALPDLRLLTGRVIRSPGLCPRHRVTPCTRARREPAPLLALPAGVGGQPQRGVPHLPHLQEEPGRLLAPLGRAGPPGAHRGRAGCATAPAGQLAARLRPMPRRPWLAARAAAAVRKGRVSGAHPAPRAATLPCYALHRRRPPTPTRRPLQVRALPVPPEYQGWRADILCNDCS